MMDTPAAAMSDAVKLHRENRVADATAAYEKIVARWPGFAEGWYNLAVLQRQAFRFDQALVSYERALRHGIDRPEEVHLNRGVIFSDFQRDHVAAARELELALTLNPGYAPALLNLANLYEDFGKRPEASSLYARILAIEPAHHEALARFANLQQTDMIDASLLPRLASALEGAADLRDRASLGFAQGRLLDAAGRYPEAFAAYTAANRASLGSAGPHFVPYDRQRQQDFVDRMISSGTPTAVAAAHPAAPHPVFIVGLFRSGSTLTEQLLAGIPGVAAGGELDLLPQLIHAELSPFFESLATLSRERLESLAARYRAGLGRLSANARYITDKRPDNFPYIGLIKSLFPDAKIIYTTRRALDNCLSIFFLHLDQQMSYALNLMDIGHYLREERRLMAHWKRRFPHDVFEFNYDELVQNPDRRLRELCGFLGLEWTGHVPEVATRSAAIKTASHWQVREPLYTSSSGRARHYATELQELSGYLEGVT